MAKQEILKFGAGGAVIVLLLVVLNYILTAVGTVSSADYATYVGYLIYAAAAVGAVYLYGIYADKASGGWAWSLKFAAWTYGVPAVLFGLMYYLGTTAATYAGDTYGSSITYLLNVSMWIGVGISVLYLAYLKWGK